MQICGIQRNCLHNKRDQFPQDLFGTQTSVVAAVSLYWDTYMVAVTSCWCPKPIPWELNLFAIDFPKTKTKVVYFYQLKTQIIPTSELNQAELEAIVCCRRLWRDETGSKIDLFHSRGYQLCKFLGTKEICFLR